jgi:4-hydroxythreonine-4-phosphate dehydrogenase
VVVGRAAVIQRAVELLGRPFQVVNARGPESATDSSTQIPVYDVEFAGGDNLPAGIIHPSAGRVAHDSVIQATDWALAGDVNGIVTSPLNKESLFAAGIRVPGHTELLAGRCGAKNVAMMLYLAGGTSRITQVGGLGVVHATLHTALRNVFGELSIERIVNRCKLAADFVSSVLRGKGLNRLPRIGVAALNPHAGEGGLFGDEELQIIAPAVARAAELGLPVSGPYPCDTLMHRAAAGEFDVVVAMYHDQGHIALKLLGLHDAVNVTLGLPIVRTSVAHGTAFDLAWQGLAQSNSMAQAICLAAELTIHQCYQAKDN